MDNRAYEWNGYYAYKVDANVAGKVMEELENTIGLNASNLVEVSRPLDAPLHNEFEWDDSVAAEKYRQNQAGLMIKNIRVQIESEHNEPKVVRGFVSLKSSVGKSGGFESMNAILDSEEKTNRLLDIALKELKSFQRKYSGLKELSQIMKAIDSLDEMLKSA